MARTFARFCFKYVMSGMTRSTPSNSDSGNIIPASMTIMSSPNRRAIMFIPNSPKPPRGITVRECDELLFNETLFNEASSPKRVAESYHRAVASNGRPRSINDRWTQMKTYLLRPLRRFLWYRHFSDGPELALSEGH